MRSLCIHQTELRLIEGDITEQEVEAVVNAANSSLLGGGGVDGAIHRAAGPELLEECRRLGGCATGQAKLTRGYKLAPYVIHAVGPKWQGGHKGEAELLASAYKAVFHLVDEQQIRSVALPAISCGIYRYPLDEAASIAVNAAWEYALIHQTPLTILFVCLDAAVYAAYDRAFTKRSETVPS